MVFLSVQVLRDENYQKMKKDETIVVVFAGDDKFAMPMGVAIYSLVSNFLKSPTDYKLKIYVIDCGIEQENKIKLEECCQKTIKVSLSFLEIPELEQVDFKPVIMTGTFVYFNQVILARLFIPQLLHKQHQKAIYLDSDVLVMSDISELWETEIPDRCDLAGVLDVLSTKIHKNINTINIVIKTIQGISLFEQNKSQVHNNCDKNNNYFNSGVLVYKNLQQLYQENFTEKIVKIIEDNQSTLPDQDALNIYFKERITYLSDSWNYQQVIPITGTDMYEKELYQEIISCPAKIIHFAGNFKPWDGYPKRSYTKEWFDYLDKTPWQGWKPNKELDLPIHYKIVRYCIKLLANLKYKNNIIMLRIMDRIIFIFISFGILIFKIRDSIDLFFKDLTKQVMK